MNKKYTYFEGNKDKDFYINSMREYVKNKQELDKYLENLITPSIIDKNLKILDACCGIGHISYMLNQINPQSTFIGIDQTVYLIDEARKLYQNKKNLSFEVGDIYDLPTKYPKEFDVSISWKTLSWLPYYKDMMISLFAVTKKYIFLSSLFYDGDVDFEIKVREYQKETGKDGFNAFYNVYSLPRFKEFVYSLGAKNIDVYDFDINIDILRKDKNVMGTYTEKLENGKRLQISGTVVMSWKIIRIEL